MPSRPELSSLWVFPVKSCRGVRVDAAEVGPGGLRFDRRWMVVDAGGRFVTQREEPRMVLLQCALEGPDIVVRAPDASAIRLPELLSTGPRVPVRVWGDDVSAIEHDDGSRFFTQALGRPVRLVCMPEASLRPVDPKRARPGDAVSFADGYPMLLASEESLASLNALLEAPVTMERFRPNLVVRGVSHAHAEDEWPTFRIGEVSFRGLKPCARCVVTTVDPETAARGKEPLRALAKQRAREGEVFFGMNVVHDRVGGRLRVGDAVEVVT